MSKQIRNGRTMWTFDIDSAAQTWHIEQVKILRKAPDALQKAHIALTSDGYEIEIEDRFLYSSNTQATDELLRMTGLLRDLAQHDLLEDTKRIARDWNAIDFCTELIEKLKDQP